MKQRLNLNHEKLQESFDRLEKVLAEELPQIGPDSIPDLNFEELKQNEGKFPEEILRKLKKSGVVIIR